MNVVYVYADSPAEWNCSEWRCSIPARAVNATRLHRAQLLPMKDFAEVTPLSISMCDWADVIVVERNFFHPQVHDAMQALRDAGKTIVGDFDDAYDLITPDIAAYQFWHDAVVEQDGHKAKLSKDEHPIEMFKKGARLCHGLTMPSRALVEDWSPVCPGYYQPNYPETERYLSAIRHRQPHDGDLYIGWGGSISHVNSWKQSGILWALARVLPSRPHVKLLIHGADERVGAMLPIDPKQKWILPWVPFREWPLQIAQFDIGLAPIAGEYDDRRSWLKPMEYSLMGVPWLASKRRAYAEFGSYGMLVDNTPDAWATALADVIDHLSDYRDLTRRAQRWAKSLDVYANAGTIVSTYQKIAASKTAPVTA